MADNLKDPTPFGTGGLPQFRILQRARSRISGTEIVCAVLVVLSAVAIGLLEILGGGQ